MSNNSSAEVPVTAKSTEVSGEPKIVIEEKPELRIGLVPGYFVTDVQAEMDKAKNIGFKYICVHVRDKSLTKPGEPLISEMPTKPPFLFYCGAIKQEDRMGGLVGIVSDLRDGQSGVNGTHLTRAEEKYIEDEMDFLVYLNITAILIELQSSILTQLAGVVLRLMNKSRINHFTGPFCWIKVSLGCGGSEKPIESWKMWDKFRTLCDKHVNIFPVLQLTKDVPSEAEVDRWLCEKVTAIFIATDVFEMNGNGFPVLPPVQRKILEQFFESGVKYVTIYRKPGTRIASINYKNSIKSTWAIHKRKTSTSSVGSGDQLPLSTIIKKL